MDLTLLKAVEARLKEVELKLGAVLEVLQLELQYQPEKYSLVKPQEGDSE